MNLGQVLHIETSTHPPEEHHEPSQPASQEPIQPESPQPSASPVEEVKVEPEVTSSVSVHHEEHPSSLPVEIHEPEHTASTQPSSLPESEHATTEEILATSSTQGHDSHTEKGKLLSFLNYI